MKMTINLKENSDEPFVRDLYKAGFSFEQVMALTKLVIKFITINNNFPFEERNK